MTFNLMLVYFICHACIPPVCSTVLNDRDFDFFEEIEKGLEKYNVLGKTYVTGDLNSRTGQFSDVLDYDKYLDDIFENDDMEDDFFDYLDILIRRKIKIMYLITMVKNYYPYVSQQIILLQMVGYYKI